MDPFALIMLVAVAVEPGERVIEHTQPYHSGQPVVRVFERRDIDEAREANWNAYVVELDELWADYREAGSSPRAWRLYKRAALDAKRRFVYNDPYFLPIPTRFDD
ncbi:MAG: hypothetical protein WD030_05705 [Pirellulales bacterium]